MAVTGTEANILDGLLWWLNEWATTLPMPVSQPDKNFVPIVGTPYLRATYLPARTTTFGNTEASSKIHMGVFQVDVFWPENEGAIKPLQRASQVVDRFKMGTRILRNVAGVPVAGAVRIQINEQPYVSPSPPQATWVQVPVNVPYYVPHAGT